MLRAGHGVPECGALCWDKLDDTGRQAGFQEDLVDAVTGQHGRVAGFPKDHVALAEGKGGKKKKKPSSASLGYSPKKDLVLKGAKEILDPKNNSAGEEEAETMLRLWAPQKKEREGVCAHFQRLQLKAQNGSGGTHHHCWGSCQVPSDGGEVEGGDRSHKALQKRGG